MKSPVINVSDRCLTLLRVNHDHRFGCDNHGMAERRTMLVSGITVLVMVVEIVAGWITGSIALLADGIHMGGHAVALGLAAFAYRLSRCYAQDRRLSLGSGKITDLAAYTSALILGGSVVWLVCESIHRLLHPKMLQPLEALVVAAIGLIINLLSAWLLAGASGHRHNHDHNHEHGHTLHPHHVTCRDNNLRAALVHVLADAATSVAAIVGLAAAWFKGWHWLDPVIALAASVVVLRWAWGLLRQTGSILLDVEGPESLRSQVCQRLENAGGNRVVDMHLWSVGQGKWTLVVSVVSHGSASPESLKARIEDLSWICHPIIEIYRCDMCDIQSMPDQN